MIVLDCCAAMGIAHRSDEGNALRSLMLPNEDIAAPSFIQQELASGFWQHVRARHYTKEQGAKLYAEALKLVTRMHNTTELCTEVFSEAVRLDHSPYDMFYFVLARRLGATMFTLDRKLVELCEQEGVDVVHVEDAPPADAA